MFNDKKLQQAIVDIMTGKQVEEAKKPLHPNQQKIDVHEPEKDEITAKDFEMLRKGKRVKEEVEDLDEASLSQMVRSSKENVKTRKELHPQYSQPKFGAEMLKKDKAAGKVAYVNRPVKEEAEDLDEMGPGRADPKAKDREDSEQQMKAFLAKGGTVQQGKSKTPKRSGRMVAAGSLARRERTMTASGGRSYTTQNEEVEELDEVSKDLMMRYADKALDRRRKASNRYRSEINTAQSDGEEPVQAVLDMNKKEFDKRTKGLKAVGRRLRKEEFEIEEIDETVVLHNDFDIELKEQYAFFDYLMAAKAIVGEEHAVELANYAFKEQDETLFLEAVMRSDIESRVKAHQNAGHAVTMPKYSTKGGQPHAEYVVTDKDSGVRRKYIHHGNVRRVENMGTAGKRD